MERSSYALTMFMSYAAMAGECTPTWQAGSHHPGASALVLDLSTSEVNGQHELIMTGTFTSVGGTPASRVAKWDGIAWSGLVNNVNATVITAHTIDNTLWIGGAFTQIDGQLASMVARRVDGVWQAAGAGFNQPVNALVTFNDELYAGGRFWLTGGTSARGVARWDGVAWNPVGEGIVGEILDFAVDPDGALIAVGDLDFAVGVGELANVAAWDGVGWSGVGAGLDAPVRAALTADIGEGEALYVGGDFASHVAVFSDNEWRAVGAGPGGPVYDLLVADIGQGAQLLAAGDFGPASAGAIAAWDGAVWTIVAGGLSQEGGRPEARALGIDPVTGALAVGGRFDKAAGELSQNVALLDVCSDSEPADLDSDGDVDASDLAFLLAAWGGDSADLTGDGVVDSSDLAIVLASWD